MRIPDQFPSPGDVRGRRVVVTGGGKGLGRLLSAAFSRAGAHVLIAGRNGQDLDEWATILEDATGTKIETCAADVSIPGENEQVVRTALSAWGGLDVWIANAGVSAHYGSAVEMDPSDWRTILGTNLDGAFYGCKTAARAMRECRTTGSIILTSSVLAQRPRKGLAAYSASKAGAEAMVKSLAVELGPEGITVNAVAPGWFDSPLAEGWMQNPGPAKKILEHTALGRWGTAEDLPGIYLFLASAASRFVTGATFTVDGGYQCV